MRHSPKRQPAEPVRSVDEVLREAFQAVEAQGVPLRSREMINAITETRTRTDRRN